jgi:diguanylate cyclase (GGDEF)-like protein
MVPRRIKNTDPLSRPNGKVPRAFVDALTDLMGRRSREDLIQCLVNYLKNIPDIDDVVVLKLFNRDNESDFNSDNANTALYREILSGSELGEPILGTEDYLQCVVTQEAVVSDGSDTKRLVLPARGLRGIAGLVVIYGNGITDEDCRYQIEVMVNIWNSHLCLIDKNERDVLTGLLNRQAFQSLFPQVVRDQIQEQGQDKRDKPSGKALAMFDIDHFKEVNDRFGHLYGDEVIVHFSQLMTRSFRYYDHVFRYGGEEFVVILTNVNMELAETILERFRKAVQEYDFPQIGTKTVSIGVMEINTRELPTTLIDKADKALYYAKQHGRNRVCVYEKLVDSGALPASQEGAGDIELF